MRGALWAVIVGVTTAAAECSHALPDPDSPAYQAQLRFFADWKRRVEAVVPRMEVFDYEEVLRELTRVCPGY